MTRKTDGAIEALRSAARNSDDTRLMPPPAALFASVIFGVIGIAAFAYGRRHALWKPICVGLALIAFPYFVSQIWLLYAIGIVLCSALYIWRD